MLGTSAVSHAEWWIVAVVIVAACAPVSAADLLPVAYGSVQDTNRDGTPDLVTATPRIANLLPGPISIAAFEYDLQPYFGATIYSASVVGTLNYSPSAFGKNVYTAHYTGDGQLTTDDYSPSTYLYSGAFTLSPTGTTDFSRSTYLREYLQQLIKSSSPQRYYGAHFLVVDNPVDATTGPGLPVLRIVRSSEHVPTVQAAPADLPATAFYYASEHSDPIGAGQTRLYTPADGSIYIQSDPAGEEIDVFSNAGNGGWFANFHGIGAEPLHVGVYEGTMRGPSESDNRPGLDVFGDHRGANITSGRFEIYDLATDGLGHVTRFAASFEQHADGSDDALYGQIRFNSTIPEPASSFGCCILTSLFLLYFRGLKRIPRIKTDREFLIGK